MNSWLCIGNQARCHVVAMLLSAVCLTAVTGCSRQAPPPPPPTPAEPVKPPRPLFTQAHVERLLYDMTLRQVEDVLGAEPDRQESTYEKGKSEFVQASVTAWYYWENADGSFIKLGFVEKKLTDITSEDLPPGAEP